uniref:Uncharacterized protein n=1 Tax=Anguilla anguilla TaxID=7936 RepID=A0A0E9PVV6_ANGAN
MARKKQALCPCIIRTIPGCL